MDKDFDDSRRFFSTIISIVKIHKKIFFEESNISRVSDIFGPREVNCKGVE